MTYDNMISSRSVETLIELHTKNNLEDPLTPPGSGIKLHDIIKNMVEVAVISQKLYDPEYIESCDATELIDIVINDTRPLTVSEIDHVIETLDARLFLSFVERQLDRARASAWDKGTGHAIEVRKKMIPLFELTEVILETPLEGDIIGQSNGD